MRKLIIGFSACLVVLFLLSPASLSAAERKRRTAESKSESGPAAAAPIPADPSIKVVRPAEGEELTATEGYTFVIGTIPSDQFTVRCNGKLCDVSADGAFIGYVPIQRQSPPKVINQKTMDAVFAFTATKTDQKLAKTIYAITPASSSSAQPAVEKYPTLRLIEATDNRWVALENDKQPDGKPLINLGKIVFIPKGCRVPVKEKRGEMFLYADLVESGPLWFNEKEFKLVEGAPTALSPPSEYFTSERTWKETIYHFQTATPLPVLCQEAADRKTLELHFLSTPSKGFVFPQPELIWGFDLACQDGETTLMVKSAPAVDRKKPLQGVKILIDPGHNPDTGALGPRGSQEQAINLLLSKQLSQVLAAEGATVSLTREDTPLELQQRHAIFHSTAPDIILSIHLNSVGENEDPRLRWGSQSFYLLPHSQPLAQAIQRPLLGAVRGHDLSNVQRNLLVTRYPATPTVLIESTHIIMPDEEKKLLTPEYREEIAKAISQGVANFLLGENAGKR